MVSPMPGVLVLAAHPDCDVDAAAGRRWPEIEEIVAAECSVPAGDRPVPDAR
jgi:hypothetical protein